MGAIAGFDNITSIDYQMASARARKFEQERDKALEDLADLKARDLDETRRLLYAALAAPRTKKYTLVGTLVNALAHHQNAADPEEALEMLINAVEGGGVGLEWVRARLQQAQSPEDRHE